MYLTGIEASTRLLRFDVVQFLVGPAATAAFQSAHPEETDGPPNDYYIANTSTQIRGATVSPTAAVWLVKLATTASADLKTATFDELPSYLAGSPSEAGHLSSNPFWLTMHAGTVTEICEQYVP